MVSQYAGSNAMHKLEALMIGGDSLLKIELVTLFRADPSSR